MDASSHRTISYRNGARTGAVGVVVGLCLFIVGAVVPYWDGGVPGFGRHQPPPGAARRLISLPTDYLFSVHFWRTDTFWSVLGWVALFTAILLAARAVVRHTASRWAAGFLMAQGAILFLTYLRFAAPLWIDFSAGEPLALLWPLGAIVITASGGLALRTGEVSKEPEGLPGARLLAIGMLLGAGLIVVGYFVSWNSLQTIPFIWTDWESFFARQSYWAAMVLGAVVLGPVVVSIQLYRSRSMPTALLGAASAGSLWTVTRVAPILIPYSLDPYVSTRPGIYLALTGALLVGATAIYLWRESPPLKAAAET